jgi:hypothetical protein
MDIFFSQFIFAFIAGIVTGAFAIYYLTYSMREQIKKSFMKQADELRNMTYKILKDQVSALHLKYSKSFEIQNEIDSNFKIFNTSIKEILKDVEQNCNEYKSELSIYTQKIDELTKSIDTLKVNENELLRLKQIIKRKEKNDKKK